MRYAEVAVNVAVNQTFHYHIPDELVEQIDAGHLVRVSFGTATQPGVVLAIHRKLPREIREIQTKPIQERLDERPVLNAAQIELVRWMSAEYLASPGACMALFLPPGIIGRSTRMVTLVNHDYAGETPVEREIIAKLRELAADGQASIEQRKLEKMLEAKTVATKLRELAAQGIVQISSMLSEPTTRKKTVRTVRRSIPPEEVIHALNEMKQRNAVKQLQVFGYIARHEFPLDVTEVYEATGANSADLRRLEQKALVHLAERIEYRDSLADRDYVPSGPLTLTDEQSAALVPIHEAISACRAAQFLLHGVTGSGKTEIYLQAMQQTLAIGRQAIFLVPEIALTPQTIRRVAERFPNQVAVVHGSLTPGERYDTWRRARRGEIAIIVGTRSALFTPLPDVGLIVLDEEHDPSYQQAPPIQPPYYHARLVAQKMSALQKAVVILGSATPATETTYQAREGRLHYLHLPDRILGHRKRVQAQAKRARVTPVYEPYSAAAMTTTLPPVEVIDMRDELRAGNTSMFSKALQEALTETLQRGEQAILFLNRRGKSTYVFCRDCGFVVECDRCDTPMTYHSHDEMMRCHRCAHQQEVLKVCPSCQSERIRYFGAGTQQVEGAFRKAFGNHIRTVRWDADTASKPDQHEALLAHFTKGEAQVMIGTQMIAKGLDLPLVTLVGVISADPGLALPDFRASERSFQLLTQVAGRAGRSILGGRVILQTYQPRHPAIVAAAQHDYAAYYASEIAFRHETGYPPYRRLGRVLVQHEHPIECEREVRAAAEQIQRVIEREGRTDTFLIGPAPCYFSRINRVYRWQVLVRSADPQGVLANVQQRPGWYIEIDPLDTL